MQTFHLEPGQLASGADPVFIARELAGILADHHDLQARSYRLIQLACTTSVGPGPTPDDLRRVAEVLRAPAMASAAAPVSEPAPEPAPSTDPIPALIETLEAALEPEPQPVATPSFHPAVEDKILGAEPAAPAEEPAPSRRQRIFDAWAATTETANEIAKRLGFEQSTVSAAISIGRKGKNPKVVAGDTARRDAQVASWEAKHQAAKAAAPVPQPAPAVVQAEPAPQPTPAVVSLPKADAHRLPPEEPRPAARPNPKQAQFAAMLVNRVLDHYAATGDHPSVVARKLGTTRQVVEDAIDDAGPSNERVRLGNIRRAKQVRAGK